MSTRARSLLLYGALLVTLFLGSGIAGFAYRHEPARETVSVSVDDGGEACGPETVSGTVTSIEGRRLVIATETGPVTVTLPPNLPIEELVRATDGLADGTPVNVGVESTQYGLVLTGVVGMEGASR